MYRYSIVENRHTGQEAIKLLDEPFAGIVYSYGKIDFLEDEDQGKVSIHFEYELLDKANKEMSDMGPFEKYIGDLLTEIIHMKIQEINATKH